MKRSHRSRMRKISSVSVDNKDGMNEERADDNMKIGFLSYNNHEKRCCRFDLAQFDSPLGPFTQTTHIHIQFRISAHKSNENILISGILYCFFFVILLPRSCIDLNFAFVYRTKTLTEAVDLA